MISQVSRRIRIMPDAFLHSTARAGEKPFNVMMGFEVTPLSSELPLAQEGSLGKLYSDADIRFMMARVEIALEASIEKAEKLMRTLQALLDTGT